MDQNTLLVIMTVFVCVSAIALIIQAGMMFGMYRASRALQENVNKVLPKAEALMDSSRSVIEENRVKIVEITLKANDILENARRQMVRVDELMGDATLRTRRQLAQADAVLDDAMYRAQEAVS